MLAMLTAGGSAHPLGPPDGETVKQWSGVAVRLDLLVRRWLRVGVVEATCASKRSGAHPALGSLMECSEDLPQQPCVGDVIRTATHVSQDVGGKLAPTCRASERIIKE